MIRNISFCTVCMNRLHHIKLTLPKNIRDNQDYNNVEFVLLDYNSSDGLLEWVNQEMGEYLNSGILKYYRTEDFEYFDRSHSRNMMFKLASGDIICNIDADNYTGEGFAEYINSEFDKNENIYIVADTKKRYYFLRNAFGRFCVKKDAFLDIRGLDEEMKSYGSETVDFYERLEKKGLNEIVIQNTSFLNTISHGDEERISNEFFLQSLYKVYFRFISHEESEFIILYKNRTFEWGFIIPERIETYLPAALKEGTLKKGNWSQSADCIYFNNDNVTISLLLKDEILCGCDNKYYPVQDKAFLLNVAKNYSFITNVDKRNKNTNRDHTVVNNGAFGFGKVFNHIKSELQIV